MSAPGSFELVEGPSTGQCHSCLHGEREVNLWRNPYGRLILLCTRCRKAPVQAQVPQTPQPDAIAEARAEVLRVVCAAACAMCAREEPVRRDTTYCGDMPRWWHPSNACRANDAREAVWQHEHIEEATP